MKVKHYDLFAGIGGFSLALDTIFYEQKNEHIFCEWEAFPTAVLKKHWPDATYYGDIADLVTDTERERLEGSKQDYTKRHTGQRGGERSDQTQDLVILTGGFPCQPFSHAGRRQGTADDRYKWPEMFAVIRNIRPDWVIAENVRGLASWNDGMVLETVCADLEAEGYEVRPYIIPACSKGAPHRRERVWIIAHAVNSGQEREERESNAAQDSVPQKYRAEDSATKEIQRADSDWNYDLFDWQEYTWETDWREVAFATCYDGVDDGIYKRLYSAIIGSNESNKISNTEAFTKDGQLSWKGLRTLWECGQTTAPSSYLYQHGLCDTLPDMSCESGQERWFPQEQTAEELRNLWSQFYALPYTKAQELQQELLSRIGEIKRNEAVVIKKDNEGVWDVWYRVYLPTSSTNRLLKELCQQTGVAKEEIKIITASKHRQERLKACGNAIVPQVAMEIFEAIKSVENQ